MTKNLFGRVRKALVKGAPTDGESAGKIVAVSMMKNEETLVESSVRYWLTFADVVILCDHNSSDGTGDILRALEAELAGRLILFRPEFEMGLQEAQAAVTNAMIREAFLHYGADLVLPLDADEYPYLLDPSHGTVRELLSGLEQNSCYSAPWMQFSLPENDEVDPARLASFSFRRKKKTATTQFCKVILTGETYREDPVFVTTGSHTLYRPSGKEAPPVVSLASQLNYAHYMYRGLSHFKVKVAHGWIAWHSRPEWRPGVAEHYRLACQKIVQGKLTREVAEWASLSISGMTGETLEQVADCVETIDPADYFPDIPLRYARKYRQDRDEFSLLLETTLALDEEYKDMQQRVSACSTQG